MRPGLSSVRFGWGSVTAASVGVVSSINGERCEIDFPAQSSWSGVVEEMQLVGADASPEGERTAVPLPEVLLDLLHEGDAAVEFTGDLNPTPAATDDAGTNCIIYVV